MITKLSKRVEALREDHDTLKKCDLPFNPLKLKEESKKKRKLGEEGESS